MNYVAFLRGINVGGKASVTMDELKKTFETMGGRAVTTLLNSGNVCFASDQPVDQLQTAIETALAKIFNRPIGVVIRSRDQINELVQANPFQDTEVGPQIRRYVTFLGKGANSAAAADIVSSAQFQVVRATSGEICSVLTLTQDGQTTELMAGIEKAVGRDVTTRNWNTVLKVQTRLN